MKMKEMEYKEMAELLIHNSLMVLKNSPSQIINVAELKTISIKMAITSVESILEHYQHVHQGFFTWRDEAYWEKVKSELKEKSYSTK